MGAPSSHDKDPTLKNILFCAVTLTKHAGIDKYGYSGSGIGFDRKSRFSFPSDRFSQNVIIFGKDILILGKGPTQGLEHTSTGEKV